MKLQSHFVVGLLLVFAAATGCRTVQEPSEEATASSSKKEKEPVQDSETKESSHKVVVYYFFKEPRCPSCLKTEFYSCQAIQEAFPDALQKGRLEWRVVHLEEPDNEHFVSDYRLRRKSVVVSETLNGKEKRWKNLEKVWE